MPSLLVVGVLVFATILLLGLLIFSPLLAAAHRRRRLAELKHFGEPAPVAEPAKPKPAGGSPSQMTQAALALSAQVMKSAHAESRLAMQLDRAGMRLRPHEWLLLRGIIAVTLGLVLAALLDPLKGLLLGLVIGTLLTSLYHRNLAAKRTDAFAQLLPEALQLIIGSLRAGFSLAQAMDAVVRELPDPIAAEFGRALGETRLGADLEDALDRVALRMDSKDLAWAVVAIRVQREVGGNLAEVLSTTVETIRERESLRRQVRSLSAEGRLSAWVLLALPIVAAAFMIVFRAEYVSPLYTSAFGILLSLIGVLLILAGGFWLSRLVKVEV